IAGLSWPIAVLLGAMLIITGPTVIQPLLREAKLSRRPAAYLRWEGVLNDAIGAVLAVLVLEALLALGARGEVPSTLLAVLASLALGTLAGAGLGIGAAFLTRFLFIRDYAPEFLKAPIVLAVALLIYGMTDLVQPEAGLIAVALYGVGLANMDLPEIEDLKRFKEGLSVFLVSGLFIVITANLPRSVFAEIGLPELAFIAAMLLLVRPAAMMLATIGSDMSWRERLFVAYIAPRGIVVAALAGLATALLADSVYEDADLILPLVFSIIVATVVLHGVAMAPFGRLLGLAAQPRPGLIIVGANPWTTAFGECLRRLGTPVLLCDQSMDALREARDLDMPTHEGHMLAPSAEDPDTLKDYEILLAATANDAFNALVCLRFSTELGAQHVYQTGFGGAAAGLDLHRQWRGKLLIGPDMTIRALLDRLEAGWGFGVENLDEETDSGGALRPDPEHRLPVALLKPNGELLLASPEGELSSAVRGRLVVFAPVRVSG
ncbi:MAG: NAD-binding protein, partial [Gammaproteobacteria bacterium]|nr:NAD-binding protein [Gammaproteobacteria bacterium]